MEASTFTNGSGRVIGVTEFGDRAAERVVVFSHPAPGSSFFNPDPVATASRGVRVIAVDRPGYGDSELHADGSSGTVADAAVDVADYLASQNIGRAGAVGWSAGGRIALALAAAFPELVDRVAVVATPAPDEDVPWVGDENRALARSLAELPAGEATSALVSLFTQMMGVDPTGESLMPFLGTDPADADTREDAAVRLAIMLDRAAAQGVVGMAADIVSYTIHAWGFDPGSIAAKTLLLYGGADSLITSAHAQWYKKHVPDSRVEMVPGTGHLLIVPMWDRVLSHLASGTRMSPA
jgi:pimeloyl-ACP methyl ester carboxylesterase